MPIKPGLSLSLSLSLNLLVELVGVLSWVVVLGQHHNNGADHIWLWILLDFFMIYGFVLVLVVGFALFFAVCEFVLTFVIVILLHWFEKKLGPAITKKM